MSPRSTTLYGILFMLLNMLAMACIDSSSKILRETMGSAHIVLLYKFSLLLMMLPWILSKGIVALKTDKIHIHVIRSFFSVLGLLFFVQGLHHVDMSDASALENIQSIMLVFIGIVFFKEQKTKYKIIAVFLGFIGALIVVNPDLFNFSLENKVTSDKYYGFTLIGIGFWTLNGVAVKILGKTEKNKTQMFYLVFFSCLWAAPIALIKWQATALLGMNLNLIPVGLASFADFHLEFWHLKYILFMSICYFIHGISYFKALQSDLSTVEPFRYTKFIFSSLLGYIFFAERVSPSAYIGFTFIILSGLALLWGEIRRSRKLRKA
jgi:drug/metabolite transporter (DMT)-like permease